MNQVDVGFNLLPALLSGRADAMLGGFLNIEGVDLAERGAHPRVVPVDQLGIPTYDELVLVANTDDIAEDPEPTRLFIAALERGTAPRPSATRRRATEAILAAGNGLDPKLTAAEVDAHPAAAAAGEEVAAVRLHETPRVGALRRLLRRPRPDLNPPDGGRDADQRPAAGPDPGLRQWTRPATRRWFPLRTAHVSPTSPDARATSQGLRRELQRRARGDRAVPAVSAKAPARPRNGA